MTKPKLGASSEDPRPTPSSMAKFTTAAPLRDPADQIPVSEVEIQEDMTCLVKPVVILDRSERVTRGGSVRMVKVRWSENEKDVTWELEDKIRDLHPELFTISFLCMSSKASSASG